ncbi:MAG: hypothetical protein GSR84_09365 [Desulfurococcales archaeon]|nr:hypothetical protein [Desulfurococcales archaeon]
MKRRVISKQLVSWSEARSIMESRIKDTEPPILPEQERTWEYLKLVGDKDPEKERVAIEKLSELGLRQEIAVNLVNICPKTPGEVRLVLGMDKEIVYDEELVSRILEIIRECREH